MDGNGGWCSKAWYQRSFFRGSGLVVSTCSLDLGLNLDIHFYTTLLKLEHFEITSTPFTQSLTPIFSSPLRVWCRELGLKLLWGDKLGQNIQALGCQLKITSFWQAYLCFSSKKLFGKPYWRSYLPQKKGDGREKRHKQHLEEVYSYIFWKK